MEDSIIVDNMDSSYEELYCIDSLRENDYFKHYRGQNFKQGILMIAGFTAFNLSDGVDIQNLIISSTSDTEIYESYRNGVVIDEYTKLICNSDFYQPNNSTQFYDIVKDILSFQDLKNNWDGYGAYPLENKSGVNSIAL